MRFNALSNASSKSSPAAPREIEALVCLIKQCTVPISTARNSSASNAPLIAPVMSCKPRLPALTCIVFCATVDVGASNATTTSRVCPRPMPPTLRCSFKYTPCHVPMANPPLLIGTRTEGVINVAFTCADMSSGPSSTWRNIVSCQLSGTMRFIAFSKSTRTVGSAFSLIVNDALVCCMKIVATPVFGAAHFGVGSCAADTKWHPRPGAGIAPRLALASSP
mmetsp:Transcript_4114/g.15015  ORF Transcript_4114/g.15015 Transcript_4114/m.15015 type:complete len:221 (+) Transcript_4114:334-996(+)